MLQRRLREPKTNRDILQVWKATKRKRRVMSQIDRDRVSDIHSDRSWPRRRLAEYRRQGATQGHERVSSASGDALRSS
jgi:hypothetical protein